MGTFDVNYCPNGEADLRSIYPNIAEADKKRAITGWTEHSTDLYKSGSTGSISQLYRDGLELGSAETSIAACTADGKWYYDSDTDTVYLFSTNHPKEHDVKAGTDWSTLVTDVTLRSSRLFESITGKYPLKHRWGTLTYDGIVTDCVAALAVGRMLRPMNGELADRLERKYNNEDDEFPKGYMQKIRDGEISLSEDINPALGEGILVESSVNASTTGGINDIRGRSSDSDVLEIKITYGGTLSFGTENTTIKYQVKGGTLMDTTYVTATLLTGYYQTLAHGLELRFEVGVIYTTDDTWYVEVSNEPIETHQGIRSIRMTAGR